MTAKKLTVLAGLMFIMGCSSPKFVQPDSPEHVAILVKQAIDHQDLQQLNVYLSDAMKGTLSEVDMSQLKDFSATGAELRTYSFLRMEDEILLLDIVKDPDSNMYKVQDIIHVPEESRTMFDQTAPLK
ncbi:hypothetical protein [Paenibacillus sp. CF384]|uniref:hypothetical protein n=1 Tax=Paenibacillus sp. CF384 TaxID=1884382 RepID=UPI000898E2FB|nr:hypothetical protein [Paenibacillus sp. CF384]SDW78831.1 hypothetical protein SAMN05518855_1005108 [Paenibacillus sp. CF384]